MTSLMHIPTEDTNDKDATGCSMLRKTDAMNDSGLEDYENRAIEIYCYSVPKW